MRTYTWHESWIKDYESLWSIIEKFKFANSINSKEFYCLLTKKSYEQGKKPLNTSFYNNHFLIQQLSEILKVKLEHHQLKSFNVILNGYTKPYLIFHSNLQYCNICISFGYHSVFHQFKYLTFCPFHPKEKLIKTCKKCNEVLQFKVVNENIGGFQCTCNHFIGENSKKIHIENWINFSPEILNRQLLQWEEKSTNNIIRYFFTTDQDFLIRKLTKFTFMVKEFPKKINSRPIIEKNGEHLIEFQSYSSIFKSIARHKKHRMNKKQRKILSLTKKNLILSNDHEISAYLYWRAYLEGDNNLTKIENGKFHKKYIGEYYKYFSPKIYYILDEISETIQKSFNVSDRDISIILSKCFGYLVLSLYNSMLDDTNNKTPSNYIPYKNPYKIFEIETINEKLVYKIYYSE